MARPVQLAPGSLALVLCRQERERAPGSPETEDGELGGRALFRAFRRANVRCFWNARLARAASRLAFQGWLRRGVLLVHGPPGSLQVLRDAWLRRALRPPRGFRIRAVGDVFPVQMNPITQSQFIPLAEVLCCAIADMNAAHVVVTQESLMDQLVKHYPGIATPSQDILYTTLGNLIKERKIYHTGEGYFIVTPQTYFITNAASQPKKRGPLEDPHSCPLPASVTYLVSMDSQAELTKENASHCKSCRCFPEPCPAEGRGVTRDGVGKGPKDSAGSTPEEGRLWERSGKDKGKSKKFGLRLLWRQMSRKDRPKKDHRSFSAQFPPEEWPVRDEENLDNIPRDVEHEIIKRINPELTVDNLIKHTVLMQKYEERKKYTSQGTSTDLRAAGHKQPPPREAGARRRQSRSGRHRRRGHSSRERARGRSLRGSQGSEPRSVVTKPEKHPKPPPAEAVPDAKGPEEELAQTPLGGTRPGVSSPQFIYKKRISNPFPGFPHRGNPTVRGYKGQKSGDPKPKQTEKPPKAFRRPRSLDASRVVDSDVHQPSAEQPGEQGGPGIPFKPDDASVPSAGDPFQNCLSSYSQRGAVRASGKGHPFRESLPGQSAYAGQDKIGPEVQWKIHSRTDPAAETQTEAQRGSASQAPGRGLMEQALVHQFQNLGLLDPRLDRTHQVGPPERQSRDTPKEPTGKCWGALSQENEGFTDDDDHQALYQKEAEGLDDTGSSLYLEEEEEEEKDLLCPAQPGHIPFPFSDGSPWDNLGKTKVTEGPWATEISSDLPDYSSKIQRFKPQTCERNDYHRPAGSLADPERGQKMDFSGENHGLRPRGYSCEEDTGSVSRVQELVDGSIFDYYSEADSEAETLQNSTGEVGEKSACWGLGPPGEELRKHFRQKPEPFRDSRVPGLAQSVQQEQSHLEGTENHSLTGDSGIDSPRTQSLASNNSVILEELKRRRSFLQNFEGLNSSRNGQILTSNSLLQLTPVINV
ncbi:LOW QUALITY PROTEIN: storkhead-box protein 1 [Antechinus flavipes]|uniref:LOW QUALITY PROTEIN: storkhead-box protein 1 n=1 Tax=Antechinus flavipes TaxID=38775 RepID=UPI002236348E|nr:LOW QUALITY PROTEIN: storkhead-box protein 1 [Antechinus flavipes]